MPVIHNSFVKPLKLMLEICTSFQIYHGGSVRRQNVKSKRKTELKKK